MNFMDSKTRENLINSYLGELTGELLYNLFAEQAEKENHCEAAETLKKLALEERDHSNIFKRFLNEDIPFQKKREDLMIFCQDTLSNLKSAASGEYKAYEEIYLNYSNIAKEEGFSEIAELYSNLRKVELRHSEILTSLASSIERIANE